MSSTQSECVTPVVRAEVEAALERVLESATFKAAPQLSAFLQYIVGTSLSGRAGRIKAYTVAVEALGRPDNFDPTTDALVRVEAGRLRRSLARYYANGGSGDPVLIEVPIGSYVPQFRWRDAAGEGTTTDTDTISDATIPPRFADVVEEAQSVRHPHQDLFAECHLRLQEIRQNIASLRAELTISQSIMEQSRRLIARTRNEQ